MQNNQLLTECYKNLDVVYHDKLRNLQEKAAQTRN